MMTKMLREHYNIIAKALNTVKPDEFKGFRGFALMEQWTKDVNALAETLKQTNPRFDSERFINACKGGQ